jgi:hypothetical protein
MHTLSSATAVAEPPTEEPASTTQRSRLHDLLSLRWRHQVDIVTDLAIRRYSIDETDAGQSTFADALDAQLADARRRLVDIEAALQRLDPRRRPAMAGGAG